LAWQSLEYFPQASHDEAMEGPLSVPQWSTGAPSSPAGGAAGAHASLVGTQTRVGLPAAELTSAHASSGAHWLEVEQPVPQ
jgi:hypothetical protein